jgi:hypothetical protein
MKLLCITALPDAKVYKQEVNSVWLIKFSF